MKVITEEIVSKYETKKTESYTDIKTQDKKVITETLNKETGVTNKVTNVEKKSGAKEEIKEVITETKDRKTGEVKVVINKEIFETPVGKVRAKVGTTVST